MLPLLDHKCAMVERFELSPAQIRLIYPRLFAPLGLQPVRCDGTPRRASGANTKVWMGTRVRASRSPSLSSSAFGPCASPTTVPFGVFCTHPVSPRRVASAAVDFLKKTPCTLPWISYWRTSSVRLAMCGRAAQRLSSTASASSAAAPRAQRGLERVVVHSRPRVPGGSRERCWRGWHRASTSRPAKRPEPTPMTRGAVTTDDPWDTAAAGAVRYAHQPAAPAAAGAEPARAGMPRAAVLDGGGISIAQGRRAQEQAPRGGPSRLRHKSCAHRAPARGAAVGEGGHRRNRREHRALQVMRRIQVARREARQATLD